MFEILLWSSKVGRFDQWFECFTVIFGVSPSVLIMEYSKLAEMVEVVGERQSPYEYERYSPLGTDRYGAQPRMHVTWIDGITPKRRQWESF